MSTNFYLQKDPYGPRHIGKTIWGGTDRGMGFIWAMAPWEFGKVCLQFDGEEVEVVDEYGTRLTLKAFLLVLESAAFSDLEHVGKEFS